jgi:hypothetical protein
MPAPAMQDHPVQMSALAFASGSSSAMSSDKDRYFCVYLTETKMAIDLTAYIYGYMPLLATGFFALFLSVLMFANLNLGLVEVPLTRPAQRVANVGNVGSGFAAAAATQ